LADFTALLARDAAAVASVFFSGAFFGLVLTDCLIAFLGGDDLTCTADFGFEATFGSHHWQTALSVSPSWLWICLSRRQTEADWC
jgi:hypothetical protein